MGREERKGHTLCVESEDCLNGYVYAAEVVPLEHNFTHSFSVLQWVHRGFR